MRKDLERRRWSRVQGDDVNKQECGMVKINTSRTGPNRSKGKLYWWARNKFCLISSSRLSEIGVRGISNGDSSFTSYSIESAHET